MAILRPDSMAYQRVVFHGDCESYFLELDLEFLDDYQQVEQLYHYEEFRGYFYIFYNRT